MKIYRNTATGAEIHTECEITGENWQEIDPASLPPAESKPSKRVSTKAVKKNGEEVRDS